MGRLMDAVAVLVDGDNLSGKYAAQIMAIAKGVGSPMFLRVYLDAQRPSDWHSVFGYRLMHAGVGKNASDLLLALDAMELALEKAIRQFVIASSDKDFTHLAHRLREFGAHVAGVGEAKTPQSFRMACSTFVEVGGKPAVALVPKAIVSDLDYQVRALIAQHSVGGQGTRIAVLGQKMFACHGIRINAHGARNWRAYFAARPELYEIDPPGDTAMVRFRPGAFAKAA